ncbi:hypothetical protein [Actinoplanes sp. ATCC 53533]|uniref:hypothetical protein n=1 Tax=Actinoplanes sp. ATCC 53533 TaxID=1288362 RepID=UPI0018F75E0A|nr:hypothetical protein [Actinoplanes sp. ATCC 53533]
MNVLFLALGAGRRRAVVEESAKVVANGGTATVVVATAHPWTAEIASGVTVIDSSVLHRAQLPWRIERLVVYRGPRFVLKKALGRRGKSAVRTYEKKVADRFHRRVFLPIHKRLRRDVRSQLIAQHITRSPRPYEWIVVTDSRSMPEAVEVLDNLRADTRIGLVWSADHIS